MSFYRNYFDACYDYQEERRQAREKYNKRMKDLDRHRGSRYFQEESEKAKGELDSTLTALRNKYTPRLNNILTSMREANRSRPMSAPTEDQERIVRMLQTK